MSLKTCICGDIDAPHNESDHAAPNLKPVAFMALLLGAGFVHAKATGRCMCGDIVKKVTGKRPPGAR